MNEAIIPVKDVASVAGITIVTLRRWWESGKIPEPEKRISSKRRYYPENQKKEVLNYSKQTYSKPKQESIFKNHDE